VGVAGPAAGKTPGMRAMVKPVMDLHRALVDEWSAKNAQLAPEEREPLPALFTNDCTVEKLSDVLRDNPRGLRYPHAHTTIATIWRCVWGRLHARPWARACADNICRHF
jgi:hypothetical protein